MESKSIFIHKLYPQIGSKIDKQLYEHGYKVNDSYSKEIYSKLSKRLSRIFQRTNSYENKLVTLWKLSELPGLIIYASNNEKVEIESHLDKRVVKKLIMTDEHAENMIVRGKIVIYYGESRFSALEAYITPKRREQLGSDSYFNSMQDYSNLSSPFEIINLFSPSIRIISVRNLAILSQMPKFISSLDSVVNGIELFDTDGLISEYAKSSLIQFRKISVESMMDVVKISSILDIGKDDLYVFPSKSVVLNQDQIDLQLKISKNNEIQKLKVKVDPCINKLRLIIGNKHYVLYSILQINGSISNDTLDEEVLFNVLMFSNANTIRITEKDLKLKYSLTYVEKSTSNIGDALFTNAMQLRKTFISGLDYSICVICEKGAYKTKLIHLLRRYTTEYVYVDSDEYGKWITYIIEKGLDKEEAIKLNISKIEKSVSYFELLSGEICRGKDKNRFNQIDVFSRTYSKVLSSKIFGIQQYQDFLYENFKTDKIILFCHCMCEANLLSGHWQQIVIQPINDTNEAINSRERSDKDAQQLLYLAYKFMTSYGTRTTISILEFIQLICPSLINRVLNTKIGVVSDISW